MNAKLVIAIIVLFIFAVFIVQNAQVVMVSFLFWKIETSRAVVLMATFVLGLFAGWILTQMFRKSKKTSTATASESGLDRSPYGRSFFVATQLEGFE